MAEDKKILISIGAINYQQAIEYIQQGFIVYAYDPRKSVFQEYLLAQKQYKSIYPYDLAVSDYNGEANLSRYHRSAATISRLGKIPSYKVRVVSMASVLKQFKCIDFLWINCEGAEIPIILNTELSLFEKCDRIDVSFHCFVPCLKITDKQVQQCLDKLSPSFHCALKDPEYHLYSFTNKNV